MKIRKILVSKYKAEQIKQSLDSVTKAYNSFSVINYLFEGKINDSEFLISPIFDRGNIKDGKKWNQLKVEVYGKLIKKENSTLIILHFSIPEYIKTPLISLFVLIFIFNIYLYINPINPLFTGLNISIAIFLNFALLFGTYFFRIKKTTEILCEILNAHLKINVS